MRRRVVVAMITVVLFPFFYIWHIARVSARGMPLTAEGGRIVVPAADVLPLDQQAACLGYARARLRRADTAARGWQLYLDRERQR